MRILTYRSTKGGDCEVNVVLCDAHWRLDTEYLLNSHPQLLETFSRMQIDW